MQLKIKQMDPAKQFAENERQSWEKQRAMGNVESVSKKFNFSDKKWPQKNFWQKPRQQATQLKGVLSISAEILAFPHFF